MQAKNRKQRWGKFIALTFSLLVIPLILLWMAIHPAAAATPRHYTDLTFGPPPEVKVPDYSRFQLKNGLVVFLMEDHELPLVSGTALIRTGDRLEPAEKIGLADLTGEVMRSGGTRKYPADTLNQLLEQRAASIETGIGVASGSASFNALSEDLGEVFGLFAQVLREPTFPEEKLNLGKVQQRGQIARRNDTPESIATREFRKLIYGSTNPYARTVEYSTLNKISRQDLVDFYQKYFYPNNMILGIVGDFEPKAMRALIEEWLGDWKPDPNIKARTASLPPVNQFKSSGVFFVDQPQLTQSSVYLGHLGGQFDNPDYPALSVMNEVLNGFGGRLFNEIRSRQGLTYSVYAVWSPQFDYPGLFLAGGQTRSDATVSFIQSVQSELEQLRTEPITKAELAFAKDSVLNSFIFNFQDPAQTLSRLMRYEYYGYPKDFIFRYRQGVEATTIADVQRVAQKYLQPNKIVTLVVGNAKTIQPPLSSLRPGTSVTAIDITIPGQS